MRKLDSATDSRRTVQKHIFSLISEGNAVVSERELAGRFSLTRSNVREILLGLEGEGVLERLPKRGYRGVNYRNADRPAADSIRYAIEHEGARLAVQNLQNGDLARLRAVLMRMERHLADGELEAFGQDDRDFHRLLVSFSRDPLVTHQFNILCDTIFLVRRISEFKSEVAQISHRAIYEALSRRDWPALEAALKEHIGKGVCL